MQQFSRSFSSDISFFSASWMTVLQIYRGLKGLLTFLAFHLIHDGKERGMLPSQSADFVRLNHWVASQVQRPPQWPNKEEVAFVWTDQREEATERSGLRRSHGEKLKAPLRKEDAPHQVFYYSYKKHWAHVKGNVILLIKPNSLLHQMKENQVLSSSSLTQSCLFSIIFGHIINTKTTVFLFYFFFLNHWYTFLFVYAQTQRSYIIKTLKFKKSLKLPERVR